ncbi:MAG TPA: hypothetical protein VFQ44_17895, partial [Streptosporangiaceae bacterium]|nr:hypothetical protein [Streptosporangiaceae bacterium]
GGCPAATSRLRCCWHATGHSNVAAFLLPGRQRRSCAAVGQAPRTAANARRCRGPAGRPVAAGG